MNPATRLLRRLVARLLPDEHRGVVTAHLDAEASTWQWIAALPAACRLRLRALTRGFGADLRHGARVARRRPGLTAAVTLTLMLGVAATNAVITVAHAVLLRPLSIPDADSVVSIRETDKTGEEAGPNLSWPDFLAYLDRSNTLAAIAGFNGGSRTLQREDGTVDRLPVAQVTGRFFDVVATPATLGRTITDADTVDGGPSVVVLSHATWQSRFGARPDIIGQSILLNTVPTTVIGVLPEAFEFAPRGTAELWLPLRPNQAQRERKYFHWMQGVARIAPGVTVAQAEADLDRVARGFAQEDPKFHASTGVRLMPLRERIVGEVRPMLLLLTAAALLVLVVASTNVAGLLLSAGAARRGEMGVRHALGAARWRVVRQLVVEHVVMTLPGILLGLVVGFVAVRMFVQTLPSYTRAGLPHLRDLQLDPVVAVLTLLCVLGVVAVTGALPAWRTAGDARLQGRGLVGRQSRVQWVLVSAQVAMAVTLLTGAGLMVQSMRRLLDVSPGFEAEGLLTFTVNPSGPRYQTPEAVAQLYDRVIADLSAVPGVTGVSFINQLPLQGGGDNGSFTVVGPEAPAQFTLLRSVDAAYFDVMGVPVDSGRRFGASERPDSPRVVIVNRLLADARFAGEALGKQIVFPFTGPDPFTIVGIVGNELFDSLDQPMQPVVYFSSAQSPSGGQSVVVRAASPEAIVPAVRSRVAAIDPALPVYSVATMEDIAASTDAVLRRRVVMTLLTGFATVAVVLVAVGVYGVLAQLVASRTREIGVRLALGARAGNVSAVIVTPGAAAAAVGLAMGLAGSLIVGRALGSLLYGTAPADLGALLVVVVTIALAVAIAALLPTRRALLIDPIEALRGE